MIKKITLVFLGMILLTSFGACTMLNENNRYDAIRIAQNDLGFEKIILVTGGTPSSILNNGSIKRPLFYVLGEREEQLVLLIVPTEKTIAAYEAQWPLVLSLYEIVEQINLTPKGVIIKEEDFDEIVFYDDPHSDAVPSSYQEVDVPFVIFFYLFDRGHLWAFQKDGQIIVINENATIFE